MPSTVPDLAKYFGEAEKMFHDAGQRIAEDGLDRMHTNIRRNTPVETRHLRNDIRTRDIVYGRYDPFASGMLARGAHALTYAWTGLVFTEVEYAQFVERGTGLWGPMHRKYMIKPKNPGGVLAFAPYRRGAGGSVILDVHSGNPTHGGTVYVRYVMHPGSPGAEMFKIGTILTEAQKDQWSQAGLRLLESELRSIHA